MSALPIVHDWRRCVAGLLPGLHGHQAKALADLGLAVALAGDCRAGRAAPHAPTAATPASSRRRFERLVANPRLSDRLAQRDLCRGLLEHLGGATIRLILDETPRGDDLRAMCVRVAYAGRALPLAWACYRPHAPPRRMPQLIRGLLRQVRSCLPPGCEAVLLADRGLAWPALVDFCAQSGWHYVLRLQGTTRVRCPAGAERPGAERAPRPGRRWLGAAEVFKKAGWRGANVVATWERGQRQPWLLVCDRPASLRHRRAYAKRAWVEQSFRDDKSAGLGWDRSRVNDPRRAARLLVLLAVAMVLAASLGAERVKAGRRRELDGRRPRRLSVVQVGLRWLRSAVTHGRVHLLKLGRLYLYPR